MAFRLTDGEIVIRNAVPQDQAVVERLVRETDCSLMAYGTEPGRIHVYHGREQFFPEKIEASKLYRLMLENSTAEPVGYIGLKVTSEEYRRAELSYFVADRYKGHGYATRALQLLTEFAFDRLTMKRLYLEIADGNIPSLRVAEKCGYQKEGLLLSFKLIGKKWHDYWLLARIH